MSESLAPIITSVVTGGTNNHATVSSEANAYATDFITPGVLGSISNSNGTGPGIGSFGVSQDSAPDMGLTITGSGNTTNGESVAYIKCTPASQDIQVLRARMSTNTTGYTINANSTGSTVYDWIYLQANVTNAATPDAAADNVVAIYTSRSTTNAADNGSPPTYGILLAVVTVSNGASSITNTNIADKRSQIIFNTGTSSNITGWNPLGDTLTYGANNGDKEFTVTTANNLTGVVQPGTRLYVNRSVTPPSQCMSFTSSSSQYASNASPSGLSFTAAFTFETWIYVGGLTGSSQMFGGQTNSGATNGWYCQVSATGQMVITYTSSSNATSFSTYQAVPTGQWLHVALVVTSTSSKTGLIYLNGTAVPTYSPSTAASTLTQGGTLALGGWAANTTQYFNGYLSESRLWSVAQSAASIQANMAISISASSTNLVGYWQGNGVFTDATTNANNLTASGGAIATQAANPYNAVEYGIITSISYSNPTTTLKIYTGNSNTIPNQTLNNPYYSAVRAPIGFPAAKDNWIQQYIYGISGQYLSGSIAGLNGSTVPINTGSWKVIAQIAWQANDIDAHVGISSSTSAFSNPRMAGRFYNASAGQMLETTTLSDNVSQSAQGSLYITGLTSSGDIYIRGVADDSEAYTTIQIECNYV